MTGRIGHIRESLRSLSHISTRDAIRPRGVTLRAGRVSAALRFAHIALALSCALAICSCVLPAKRSAKPTEPAAGVAEEKPADQETDLIKPTIPGEEAPSADAKPYEPSPEPTGSPASTGEAPIAGSPETDGEPLSGVEAQPERWEDQKVKRAALRIAENLSAVKKMKICYAIDKDEWWVVLYDEVGPSIDLKQFIWNREEERLEPFLVLKRIPSSQLETHLTKRRPGRACEVVDVESRAPAGERRPPQARGF